MPNYINPHDIPQEICSRIRAVIESDRHGQVDSISTTELIDSPLQRVLRLRMWNDVVLEYSEQIWALLGTAVHHILSLEYEPMYAHEYRVSRREQGVSDLCITGTIDRISVTDPMNIQDWKVTSVWSFIFKNALASWEKQLNVYNWLNGMQAEELYILAILRDHSTGRAELERLRGNNEYPLVPFQAVRFEPWTEEKVTSYIKQRMLSHTAAQETERIENVPPCSPEERWYKVQKYALRKETSKRARKLFDTQAEAEQYACDNNLVEGHVIEPRGKENVKCARFCDYRAHHGVEALCPYFHRFVPDYQSEEDIV